MEPKKRSLLDKVTSFIKRKTSQQYKFNQQFENGTWNGLRDIGELARYNIITGYIGFFCKHPRVLDLGCGEGILQEKFAAGSYTHYTGVDFSDVAIANAQQLANSTTEFRVGDLNKLKITGSYDAIVYNESIYYLDDPKAAIQALFPHLTEGGIIIFSIVDKHGKVQTKYWDKLNSLLTLVDSTRVYNAAGHSWTIQVYKK